MSNKVWFVISFAAFESKIKWIDQGDFKLEGFFGFSFQLFGLFTDLPLTLWVFKTLLEGEFSMKDFRSTLDLASLTILEIEEFKLQFVLIIFFSDENVRVSFDFLSEAMIFLFSESVMSLNKFLSYFSFW